MIYEIKYDPKAEKQLEKLPRDVTSRIVKRIGFVGEMGRGIEKIKDEKYGYKIRIGDYRALVDITYEPPTIWVRYIDHRSRIYERI